MNMRKVLAVLCLGAVLAFAGCGESSGEKESKTENSSAVVTTAKEGSSSSADEDIPAAGEESSEQQADDESSQAVMEEPVSEPADEGIMTDADIAVNIKGGYIGTEYYKAKEDSEEHILCKTYYNADDEAVL